MGAGLDNLNIRLAEAHEASTVSAIVDAAYSKWVPVLGRKPAPMLVDYADLVQKRVVYVVIDDGQIAGVLAIWPQDDALYIDNIAVHPDFQRRGIGDRLLSFAEEQARAAGLRRMSLLTNQLMEYNQVYYLKHGYVETRRATTEDGRRTVWMDKLLT